jgi:hypothetical protein
MEHTAAASGARDPSTDEVAWRRRLDENRAIMQGLRQHTGRVSAAIAATERSVASTLRTLAADDRRHGRTDAADRREARADDAERFADHEIAAAAELTGSGAADVAAG